MINQPYTVQEVARASPNSVEFTFSWDVMYRNEWVFCELSHDEAESLAYAMNMAYQTGFAEGKYGS